MQIHKLTIQGFKSFTKKQILDFNKFGNGLIFISGKNKVEPSLGGNGTGKSSMIEALTFAFYGKTSTNDKAGNLKNWQTNEKCKVAVDFMQHDVMYTLERTWNPNTLKLNDETVTQDVVETLLGMNFSAFIYSVFISQQAEKFIDLSSVDKMEIFTTILDLDKWSTFSDKAKEKRNSLEKEMLDLERHKTLIVGELSGINVEEIDKLIEEHESNREVKLIELQETKVDLEKQYTEVTDTINGKKKEIEEIQDSCTEIEALRVEINGRVKELQQKIIEEERETYRYDTRIGIGEEELELLMRTEKSPTCPSCFQKVNPELLKNNKEVLEESLKEIRVQIEKGYSVIRDYKSQVKNLMDDLDIETTAYTSLNTKKGVIKGEVRELDVEAQRLLYQQDNIDTEIITLQANLNPYSDMKQKMVERLEKLTKDLQEVELNQTVNNQYSTIYEYWIKGFKDTKLMLLSEALQEFEIETNNKLQELGMTDWSIKTEVDTETKSGTIKRGFTIMVNSPINNSLVPFTCWSGGEGQRLRLAVTLGLIDFIKNKRGVNWDILIFDEGTQFLSEEGISDLVSTLKDKAENDNLKILLIDHRNLNSYGDFIKEIIVTKTEDGSQIWNT
jgi:DNA repair exonuclease SbcCD ATPase subunit